MPRVFVFRLRLHVVSLFGGSRAPPPAQITKLAKIVGDTRRHGFQVLAGSAGFLFAGLMVGCVGGVCALANVAAAECAQIVELVQRVGTAPHLTSRTSHLTSLHAHVQCTRAVHTWTRVVHTYSAHMDTCSAHVQCIRAVHTCVYAPHSHR